MKFQRTLSQPYILLQQDALSSSQQNSGNQGRWQRLTQALDLDAFWKALIKFATGSSEPTISQRCDRNGTISYTIYDPITQQHSGWLSEVEARDWLEQRYYR
ncbi:MAG: hypothetical protein AAF572_20480 [Cyanobacteria bacterium P01_B01_bin.77]